jgi:ribonuclease P protein component
MRRSDRLRDSRDYRRVARQGRRFASAAFVLLVAPIRTGCGPRGDRVPVSRLGVTVSRKVGNAVTRNRVKRAIREWFRRERDQLGEGADVVVIARAPAAHLDGNEIAADLRGLLRSAKGAA